MTKRSHRSERQLVDQLRRKSLRAGSHRKATRDGYVLEQGMGDDCAVISTKHGRHDILVTTDMLLEGIHFRREWQPAHSAGYKVLLRGLSDIAAMGGEPRFAFLSLGLPRGTESRWVDEFFEGLLSLASQTGVVLAGGDTAASRSGMVADIMVIGEIPKGKAVLRSGARPGDEIWVSGALGGAAYALQLLKSRKPASLQHKISDALLRPLFYPPVRFELGRELRARRLASAMMDISDGLSIDLARLCKASGVGARIEEAAVPRSREATLAMALHGGEDFELLFTVPAAKSRLVPSRLRGFPLSRIGKIVSGSQLSVLRGNRELLLPVRGFEHF